MEILWELYLTRILPLFLNGSFGLWMGGGIAFFALVTASIAIIVALARYTGIAKPVKPALDYDDIRPIAAELTLPPIQGTGSLLAATGETFVRTLRVVGPLILVLFLPVELFVHSILDTLPLTDTRFLEVGIRLLIELFIGSISVASLAYIVLYLFRRGSLPALHDALYWGYLHTLRIATTRLLTGTLLWIVLLAGTFLCIFLAGLLHGYAGFPSPFITYMWRLDLQGSVLFGGIFLLCYAPALFILVRVVFVEAIASLDTTPATRILPQSWELTRGYRWRLLVSGAILSGVVILMGALLELPAQYIEHWGAAALGDIVFDLFSRLIPMLCILAYLHMMTQKSQQAACCAEEMTVENSLLY